MQPNSAKDQLEDDHIRNTHPLYLIVGEHKFSPCDHETFTQFKLWVAESQAEGIIDTYCRENVLIEHWDDQAGDRYPHLLNPCECGTYLPMVVDPNPMFSSAIGLLSELKQLINLAEYIPEAYQELIEAMMQVAERSLDTNLALEIR